MESGQLPNRRLRLQRRLHGWSQEDVASGLHRVAASLGQPELGVDSTMVSRWERGTRKPRPRYVRLLCCLFDLPADALGIGDEVDAQRLAPGANGAPEDDVDRREFIRKVTELLAVPAAPGLALRGLAAMGPEPWERLAGALERPGTIDVATVDHLEEVTVALERLGPTRVGAGAILGPVTGHLDAISVLLKGSPSPSQRARLCSLAAETAGLAGWLRWDMDDAAGAASYFGAALRAAREAGDRALVAYLAGSAACQPPHRESPRRRLEQLRSLSWSDATPSTRVWLAAKEADAHALLGDATGCLRALDRAQRALDDTGGQAFRRPRFDTIDQGWLNGERGASLAKLGRTRDARAILLAATARLGASEERDWLWLAAAVTSTYVQDREPEEACRLAEVVLERAARKGLAPVVQAVRGLHRQLSLTAPAPAVQALDERLRAELPAGGRSLFASGGVRVLE
jgi:transcriptional regulator with XRE-family HTH domain